jgi:hypothetical protein
MLVQGRAVAQAVSRWRPGFEPWSGHMGFVVYKVALGQVFFEHFPCHFIPPTAVHSSSFIRGYYSRPNSGRRTKRTHPATRN